MLNPQGFHTNEASLLPKLRDHFAEFLNEGSHERLRILSSPTCVGLWYGLPVSRLEVFLGSLDSGPSLARGLTPLPPQLKGPGFSWTPRLRLRTGTTNALRPYLSTSLHHDNLHQVVQEYEPASHRLRLSASP